MECPFFPLDHLRKLRPVIPNQINKFRMEQSMMDGFKFLTTYWTFIASSDASSANLFPCWQPVDIGPLNKDFNLCRKIEAPKVLPKRFKRVPQ